MPEGLYRGKVVAVDGDEIRIVIPRLSTNFYKAEGEPDVIYEINDGVLVGFFEGQVNNVEIVRKLKLPTITGLVTDTVEEFV